LTSEPKFISTSDFKNKLKFKLEDLRQEEGEIEVIVEIKQQNAPTFISVDLFRRAERDYCLKSALVSSKPQTAVISDCNKTRSTD